MTDRVRHAPNIDLRLMEAAHAHALKYEATTEFPGVDIDAIHHKLELDAILREMAALA